MRFACLHAFAASCTLPLLLKFHSIIAGSSGSALLYLHSDAPPVLPHSVMHVLASAHTYILTSWLYIAV